MAISFDLTAESRTDTGKGASRRLRRAGKVPAIMYGGDKEPQSITLAHNEVLRNLEHEAFYSHILTIKLDGSESPAILRDMQRHPSKPIIMHMDLQRVDMSASLKTNVPVHIIGEDVAPGIRAGGRVSHELTEVAIECMPSKLPEYIEVDISALEIGDSIHLSGLTVPEGITLTDLEKGEDHDHGVVSIYLPRVVEEPEEELAAEGESAEGAEVEKDEDKSDGES